MLNKNHNILITGGTGFLGQALITKLSKKKIKHITVISRNEGQLIKLKEQFPFINILPGDISNKFDLLKAFKNIDVIFHLAAFKHVLLAEESPSLCISSNIIGTQNILELSLKYKIKFIIGISTDKAAKVNGVYGATKLLHERLFSEYEKINKKTAYRTVRYGNVLYSTGSVLFKWREALKKNKPLIVTDLNATRFYWTVDHAINLIFDCLKYAKNSQPYVPKMKSLKLGDLLKATIEKYANDPSRVKIKKIGLQQGENMHEIIDSSIPDSSEATKYKIEEIKKLI